MTKKKQACIYVARDNEYIKSDVKMKLEKDGHFYSNSDNTEVSNKPFYGLKLKKGEQKRIPVYIDTEKAEVVR